MVSISSWATTTGRQAIKHSNRTMYFFMALFVLWHVINGGHLGKQMDYCMAKTLFHNALHI